MIKKVLELWKIELLLYAMGHNTVEPEGRKWTWKRLRDSLIELENGWD